MVLANCTFRVPSFVACSLVSLTKLCSILAFFAASFPKITMHKPQDVMNAYQPVHPRSRKHNRTAKHSNLTESQRICTHLSLGWVIHTKSLSTSLYPSFSSQLLFITFKLLWSNDQCHRKSMPLLDQSCCNIVALGIRTYFPRSGLDWSPWIKLHTKKSWCKIIEIFTTQQHSLLTCPSWSVHACALLLCLLLLCFGIKGRCTWKMVGLRISTTEPNCWVACQGVWGSYPSHDRSIQLSYLQLLEWRKIYVAY